MPIMLLKLFGWGTSLGGWIAGVLKWLFKEWYRPVIAGLLIALAWLLLVTVPGLKGERDAARGDVTAERTAHEQSIANLRAASAAALAAAERNKARVEQAWRAQLEESRRENLALRAEYRGRAARFVREQAEAAAYPGSADPAGLPDAPELPAGSVHNAASAIIPVTDLERCADAFAQLAAVIGWADAVGTPPAPP